MATTKKVKRFFIHSEENNVVLRKKRTTGHISNCLSKKCEIILDESQLIDWTNKLKAVSIFSFALKKDDSDRLNINVIGIAFSVQPGVSAYIPMTHNYLNAPRQLARDRVFELLKPILEDNKILKVGQDCRYSYSAFQNYGIELRGVTFDTMLESYTLNSVSGGHDINSIAKRWLACDTFDQNIKKGKKKRVVVNQIAIEEASRYVAGHAEIIFQLHLRMWEKLQKCKGLLNVFQNIEMPLVPVLSRIERNGVSVDSKMLYEQSQELTYRLCKLEEQAHDIVGQPFNLLSTKQLQTILFEIQKIKPLKKTPGGSSSTSEDVLEVLALDYPLPKIILEYRELAKLKSSYIDKLLLMIHPKTKRIHTSYHQAVTATGRLSSSEPNLQNIPFRTKEGRRIRRAFVAPENCFIVSADYSQIELRIMAHLSCDRALQNAFIQGKDIHCMTAAEMFHLPLENVTFEHRRNAKTINFGLIYGMSVFGLSRQLNVSCKESQKYINRYFERYPKVLEYMKNIRIQAKENGYVETLNGRRLYLPDIRSKNAVRRAAAERAAINAPMQGTAADIIKNAMISVDLWLRKERYRAKMIMQVHDELIFEVYEEDIKIVTKRLRKLMENSVQLNVPLLVKVRSGRNWDQVH